MKENKKEEVKETQLLSIQLNSRNIFNTYVRLEDIDEVAKHIKKHFPSSPIKPNNLVEEEVVKEDEELDKIAHKLYPDILNESWGNQREIWKAGYMAASAPTPVGEEEAAEKEISFLKDYILEKDKQIAFLEMQIRKMEEQ